MQANNGELLPRVERLPQPLGASGFYVAKNATVTIYQPSQVSSVFYTLLFFFIGCVVGVLVYFWNNNTHSTDVELAILRNVRPPASERISVIITPRVAETLASPEDIDEKVMAKSFKPHAELEPSYAVAVKQADLSIQVSQVLSESLENSINRAISRAKEQSFKSAESTLLAQYRRGNTNKDLLTALGRLYSKHRKWEKAALSFLRACSVYAPDASCFYNLAVSYDHLKERGKAIDAYQSALRHYSTGKHGFATLSVHSRLKELKQW